VQLRHARLVHPQLGPDLLHRDLAEVVEPDQLALARGQRGDGGPNPVLHLAALEGRVGRLGLRGHQHGRQRRVVLVIVRGEGRGGLDGVDAQDRAVEALLVRANLGRQVGHRRLVPQLAPQRLAGRLQLAPLAADAPRPGLAPKRVDHRAAHPPLREGLELDAARLVVALRRVNQAEHAVLHQIADVDRVGHRGGEPARKRFDEGKTGHHASALVGGKRCDVHRGSSGRRQPAPLNDFGSSLRPGRRSAPRVSQTNRAIRNPSARTEQLGPIRVIRASEGAKPLKQGGLEVTPAAAPPSEPVCRSVAGRQHLDELAVLARQYSDAPARSASAARNRNRGVMYERGAVGWSGG